MGKRIGNEKIGKERGEGDLGRKRRKDWMKGTEERKQESIIL
jgi:hypothetical protein